jgi:hypothetical protein
VFPTNFPEEVFYASATSANVPTAGCAGTAQPGRALVTLALECAFVNGGPTAGEQMTFGRIRVRATSGLCPNTTYRFRHPFGTETFTPVWSMVEVRGQRPVGVVVVRMPATAGELAARADRGLGRRLAMSTSLRGVAAVAVGVDPQVELVPGVAGADLGYLPPARTRVARRREPGGESGGESGAAGVGWL